MKKLLVFLVFCLMNLVSFSAMKDGIYYVEKEYDNEWTSFVKITVKNDKIIGAQYDRKNSEGVLLSFDQKENLDELYTRTIGFLPYFDIDSEWVKQKFSIEVTGAKQFGIADDSDFPESLQD